MYDITRDSSRYYTSGPDVDHVYYLCPHDSRTPRHVAQAPDHPATISVREDTLTGQIRRFFLARIFGPDRAALLAEQLPAGAAEDAARRQKQAARLRKRLKQIDATEGAHVREIQALYNKTRNQVTLWATITSSTPAALAAIIADSETPALAALLTGQDHPSDLARQPGWATSP